jgi:hypothetical protein
VAVAKKADKADPRGPITVLAIGAERERGCGATAPGVISELGGADRQHAAVEIDVRTGEPQRLRYPQPASRKQAEECGEGRGAQPALGRELPRLPDERRDLGLGEDMVERPTVGAPQKAARWHLGGGVKRGPVARKRSDDLETACWELPRAPARQSGPSDDEIERQRATVPARIGESREAQELASRDSEFEA